MGTMHTIVITIVTAYTSGSSAVLGSLVRERDSVRSLCEGSESMLWSGLEGTSE